LGDALAKINQVVMEQVPTRKLELAVIHHQVIDDSTRIISVKGRDHTSKDWVVRAFKFELLPNGHVQVSEPLDDRAPDVFRPTVPAAANPLGLVARMAQVVYGYHVPALDQYQHLY
jgi:hypothetical protein